MWVIVHFLKNIIFIFLVIFFFSFDSHFYANWCDFLINLSDFMYTILNEMILILIILV